MFEVCVTLLLACLLDKFNDTARLVRRSLHPPREPLSEFTIHCVAAEGRAHGNQDDFVPANATKRKNAVLAARESERTPDEMKMTTWMKMMQAARLLAASGILLGGGLSHAGPPVPEAVAAPPLDVQAKGYVKSDGIPAAMEIAPAPAGQVGPAWVVLGPASTNGGQVTVPPNNQIAGAVNALAIHSTNPDIIYVAAVNGGVWRTTNGTATSPQWSPLADGLASLSMGALEFDPTDATFQTLVATSARESSLGGAGSARIAVLRTTDGGATRSVFGTSLFANENLMRLVGRGTVIIAARHGLDRHKTHGVSLAAINFKI